MGNSLLAVVNPPSGQDRSGRGRLLGPPEFGPIGPEASQDHGDLAGYGDTRLLRSDAPRQPRSPCLEGRPALHFREKDAGSLIKAGAGESIPAFRYPALPVRFSGLIPSRRQSEIGSDIPSPLEPVRLIDRGAECKGCYRPDARHRHEPSQRQVVVDKNDGSPCPKPPPWQRQPPAPLWVNVIAFDE